MDRIIEFSFADTDVLDDFKSNSLILKFLTLIYQEWIELKNYLFTSIAS